MSEVKIAAAYIRVSTEDQVEYSPDAQLTEIRKYAAGHGYIQPNEFIFMDEGKIIEEGTPDEIFSNPKSDRLKSFLSKIL